MQSALGKIEQNARRAQERSVTPVISVETIRSAMAAIVSATERDAAFRAGAIASLQETANAFQAEVARAKTAVAGLTPALGLSATQPPAALTEGLVRVA